MFSPIVDEIVRADLDAPRKQRHTLKRIYDRLIGEYGMRDVWSRHLPWLQEARSHEI